MDITNNGVWASGEGRIEATTIVAGAGANVRSDGADARLAAAQAQIRALLEELRISMAEVPAAAGAIAEAEEVHREIGKTRPDRYRLNGLLASIATAVGSVGLLAERVAGVQHAIQSMF